MKGLGSILILSLCCVLSACKKIDYSKYGNSCELCDFAEETEGTYRGAMSWDSLLGLNPNNHVTLSDSVTVDVEQIFLNNNPYDDSTNMYFRTTWIRDQVGLINIDTILINNPDGIVGFYSNISNVNSMYYITRSSQILNGVYTKFSEYDNYDLGHIHFLHIDATLYKQ
jgi:hypothetical protein